MRDKVTASLMREQASSQLVGVVMPKPRAAEIAVNVEAHIAAVSRAAQRLDFNDEPARFNALLAISAPAWNNRK